MYSTIKYMNFHLVNYIDFHLVNSTHHEMAIKLLCFNYN